MNTKGSIYTYVENEMKSINKRYQDKLGYPYETLESVAISKLLPKIKELERVWIPVTERIPEANFDVLIVHQGETKMGYCEDEVWYNSNTHRRLSDVTAWQPLPLPQTK